MPSEADLVSDFGVSRTTARWALDELRRQGLVRREPGRGTFLASPRLRSNLAYLHSFTEEIERWGYTPGARLVEAHFHPERYQHYNELSTRPVEVSV